MLHTDLCQVFKETCNFLAVIFLNRKELFNTLNEAVTLLQTRERHDESKVQTNNSDEYRRENPQQNINKIQQHG